MSFNSSKLNNGLNIVTYSMPYVNSVSINIIVQVGSSSESEEEAFNCIRDFYSIFIRPSGNAGQLENYCEEQPFLRIVDILSQSS
jgi:hypothetical protein